MGLSDALVASGPLMSYLDGLLLSGSLIICCISLVSSLALARIDDSESIISSLPSIICLFSLLASSFFTLTSLLSLVVLLFNDSIFSVIFLIILSSKLSVCFDMLDVKFEKFLLMLSIFISCSVLIVSIDFSE